MNLPNFLIIGAAKSGTTSLYAYLKQHPQIFMSVPKEPTFFGNEGGGGTFHGPGDEDRAYHSRVITSFDEYARLFAGVTDQRAVGEASIYSLYLPNAADQLQRRIPRATLLAVLRHPADRAYSAYLHTVRQGRERESFAEALRREPERVLAGWNPLWHYRKMGFYHAQVARYLDRFSRAQMHFYLYEDFQQDPARVIREAFGILGVDDTFAPNTEKRYKVAFVPQSRVLERTVHRVTWRINRAAVRLPARLQTPVKGVAKQIDLLADWNRRAPGPIPPDIRASLTATYRDDILRLQDLLQRDLSHWMV